MKPAFKVRRHCHHRTRNLSLFSAVLAMSGCAIWPGSGLPTYDEVAKEGAKAAQEQPTPCFDENNPELAKACARFVIGELSNLEVSAGRWDTIYSLGSVAAGTLAAIYLKSSTDRSQALEDLTVGVAAIAGIRGVLKPAERRAVAKAGREALQCMLASADGIELLVRAESAPPIQLDMIRTLQSSSLSGETSQLSANSQALLGMKYAEVNEAHTATNHQAAADEIRANRELAFGVLEVLNHVKSAMSEPIPGIADLHSAQRKQVEAMLGSLKQKINEEAVVKLKAQGAEEVLPAGPQVKEDPKRTAAKQHISRLYASCANPTSDEPLE